MSKLANRVCHSSLDRRVVNLENLVQIKKHRVINNIKVSIKVALLFVTFLPAYTKVLDKQSQLMNSPCGDPNKELNHKEENQ